MDTLRADICYRPLRIGWAIHSGDFEAFRKAVRYSYALWGGRFNPIVFADKDEESKLLIELFRVDVIIPIGDSDEVRNFSSKYPYIINPFFRDQVFYKGDKSSDSGSYVLDVFNAFMHFKDRQEWKEIKEIGVRHFAWNKEDPLSDVFLSQFGEYPNKDDIGTDYLGLLRNMSDCEELMLDSVLPVPGRSIDYPSISYLSRHGLKRHHAIRNYWDHPGFFVGEASNLDDLVCCWNLRACDITLWFVDAVNFGRYTEIIPAFKALMREKKDSYRNEEGGAFPVWVRDKGVEEVRQLFGDSDFALCNVTESLWNGHNIRAPMMYLGEASALGVMSNIGDKTRVSFSLLEKPFCSSNWFFQQHLVASVSFIGGLYGDERRTFSIPYIQELNEFYARTMHFQYSKLRIEPGRIGIIIDAADHDSFLYALPVPELVERVFDIAGFTVRLSGAGLIMRQLIAQLGDVQGGRVFKIPGVRKLLKLHGPGASVTKVEALRCIGSADPEQPNSKFNDYEDLYIEQRARGEKLTPNSVFGFLVEKGVFRIGVELECPSCRITSWLPIDALSHQVSCDLCGNKYDPTRKLANIDRWHYRRSGVLGIERNAQGVVPVVLTLQQLHANLQGGLNDIVYSPSLDIELKRDGGEFKCEIDFVLIIPRPQPGETVVIIGECKDQGQITPSDIANLKFVADSFPSTRFRVFVALSKIAPFTDEEIKNAKVINDKYHLRAILLTAQELEPYYIYERTKKEAGIDNMFSGSPEHMAKATDKLYFTKQEVGKQSSD